MFELRCSEFELGCSGSARHPHDREGWRFKSSMIPLVAGVDLNHQPLGYEGKSTRCTNQLQPSKPNKILEIQPVLLAHFGLLWW